MSIAIVTGSAGLIGAETVRFLSAKGLTVHGIDNNMRRTFFGARACTDWARQQLEQQIPGYCHHALDIRDTVAIPQLFARYGADIQLIVHAAAQPSHDWAALDPTVDFTINANGTLNLLEAMRHHAPQAVFIHCSTNKVYGDQPNRLPLIELPSRWELDPAHPWAADGIDETLSIDHCTHSLFGVSKVAGDLLVQEYGRYFGLRTGSFRGGCLTGPGHSGAPLHGFLSYLMQCAVTGTPYTVLGYKGKQVRDNIHAYDLVNAFWHFFQTPKVAAVYNIGGSRHSNCSMLEAISLCEELTGRPMCWNYQEQNRIGDHIWWISSVNRFRQDFPQWEYTYDIRAILTEIRDALQERVLGRSF
ncbi:MAG: NAD-dependent epimerase/dehydratase family protein [Magnetococcales bacterium]|nr:NAD-dependent epimerase/dehydratase family protein [Magnetococcales bacterium]NGZ06377.1 NAD-dependent epimerase/dehydratase family protein [Magnetococcales bacterium]